MLQITVTLSGPVEVNKTYIGEEAAEEQAIRSSMLNSPVGKAVVAGMKGRPTGQIKAAR